MYLYERTFIDMTDKKRKRMMTAMRVMALVLAVIMIIGVILQGFM